MGARGQKFCRLEHKRHPEFQLVPVLSKEISASAQSRELLGINHLVDAQRPVIPGLSKWRELCDDYDRGDPESRMAMDK